MREIKFRAWLPDLEQMVDVEMLHRGTKEVTKDFGKPAIGHKQIHVGGSVISVSYNFVLMQYTGLLDKNGVEIYEGDIIKDTGHTEDLHEFIYEVRYMAPRFVAYNPHKSPNHVKQVIRDMDNIWNWKKPHETMWEVIGNVYESPDLLTPTTPIGGEK